MVKNRAYNMCYPVCLWQCSVRAESVHAPWGAVCLGRCLVLWCSIVLSVVGAECHTGLLLWLWRHSKLLSKERPTWYHLFIISLLNAQHISDVNTSILRSLRLMCWVISWVVLIWFDVCWSYVVVCLWWCGILMQSSASTYIRIPHHHSQTTT